MTRPIGDPVVARVRSPQQRHFYASTRGIATPEQRMAREREAEEIIANLGMTPGQIETALGWAVKLAMVGHPHTTEAVNVLTKILSTNRITRTDLYVLDHRVGISLEPLRPPRPDYCCGKCPETMTGWDCTCPGNPQCMKETK